MFLWKLFGCFLMIVLFYLHAKNILILNSFEYCFLFTSFLFYLPMSIDNAIWHTRVGVFYSFKAFIREKSNTKTFHSSLLFFFTCKFFLYRFQPVLNCIITSYPFQIRFHSSRLRHCETTIDNTWNIICF